VFAATRDPGGSIDLPADIQRELRDLEARADRISHYELLAVAADADGGAIRRAYLERSKRLHPDSWYRKEVGEFGALLSKWFQKLAAAYQVLSDEESRAVYDKDHKTDLSAADRVAVEKRELSVIEEERRGRERRERLLRTKGFARIGAARRLFEEAIEHASKSERSQAIDALKAARELDPNRKEIGAKLVELEREQARSRANSALASGKEREERKMYPQAIAAYSAAFQLDPKSGTAAAGAARCAMENGDPQTAATWGVRAIELNPNDDEARLALAEVFVEMKMKARAKAELNAILKKNPEHPEAKALLKGL
jgi:tetratricopeptide (TPR) repeat protein